MRLFRIKEEENIMDTNGIVNKEIKERSKPKRIIAATDSAAFVTKQIKKPKS